MKFALDTDILAYAEGLNGTARQAQTRVFLDRLDRHNVFITVQVLGELFGLLVRKGGKSARSSRDVVLDWRRSYPVLEIDFPAVVDAMELVVSHKLRFWDAVIVAASAEAGCNLLLTEDMHDGFVWRGLTITNPFKLDPHPVLRDLLSMPH